MKFYVQKDKQGNIEMAVRADFDAVLDESMVDKFSEVSEKEYKEVKENPGKFRFKDGKVVKVKVEKKLASSSMATFSKEVK